MSRATMSIHLRKLAAIGQLAGMFVLVLGLLLSAAVQPAAAQAADVPTVTFDQPNAMICNVADLPGSPAGYLPITVTGHYHLPAGMSASLQTLFFVVHPIPTDYQYGDLGIVTGDGTFSITGYWPGIYDGTSVVEIHFGANLLDPLTSVPIVDRVGSLDYWWNPGDCGLTPTPVTPTATPVTPTPVTPTPVTPTATPVTPTSTPITPTGVTPTTSTPITPTGVTPTTITPVTPTSITPTTVTPVTPTSITPTTVTPVTPTSITPTDITPEGVTPTPITDNNIPLIPVTGVDKTGGGGSAQGNQNLLLDLSLSVLGFSLICFGIAQKLKRTTP